MRAIGIRELKSRLSHYVRLAEAGERVLVTDRGRVVAELGPPRGTEPPRQPVAKLDELLAELDRSREDR